MTRKTILASALAALVSWSVADAYSSSSLSGNFTVYSFSSSTAQTCLRVLDIHSARRHELHHLQFDRQPGAQCRN